MINGEKLMLYIKKDGKLIEVGECHPVTIPYENWENFTKPIRSIKKGFTVWASIAVAIYNKALNN